MFTFSKGRIVSSVASFVVVAALSFVLLSLFPFYPLYVALGVALVLGVVAIELPGLALLVSILLSVLASTYQSPFIGLIFLVVLVLLSATILGWFDMLMVTASWALAFALPAVVSPLAIVPTIIVGFHDSRENALKIGAITGISLFLLSWCRGVTQAAMMLVPSPNNYAPKPIPDPWRFQAFIPNADAFTTDKLSASFATLTSSIGDFRIYALIIAWALAGFLVAILASRWKGYLSVAAALIGVLPLAILSFVFAEASLLQIGSALVGTVIVSLGYTAIQPLVSAPSLSTFTSLERLVTTGIPQKYTLLLGSPACDERNLVVEQFIQSGVDKKIPCFMVTSDTSFAEAASQKFGDTLTVLVANPRATATGKNVVPLTTAVQNLTALNIELVKLVKDRAGSGARVVLDIISEVMLAQKLPMTRKWVTDIVPRLENWGFTVFGVFNPGLHSTEEVQGIIELFNGYVQIYEKDFQGKSRKVITVRKMANLQYDNAELFVDRERLAGKKGGQSGFKRRLGR